MSIAVPPYIDDALNPAYVREELLGTIRAHIDAHPRSHQTAIGPSEIGQACVRRLAYKLAGVEAVNSGDGWFPTIGTAMHTWLEGALQAVNAEYRAARYGSRDRYLIEETVRVGEVGGQPVHGHCDVFDTWLAMVLDWKLVGTTQLRKYKGLGPGNQYRTQAHLYGRGWQLRGHKVETVAIFFLPRTETIDRAHLWCEPYDEQIAVDALTRVDAVAGLVAAAGPAAAAALPTLDDYCSFCPFFLPGSTELEQACPGHPTRA